MTRDVQTRPGTRAFRTSVDGGRCYLILSQKTQPILIIFGMWKKGSYSALVFLLKCVKRTKVDSSFSYADIQSGSCCGSTPQTAAVCVTL